MENNSVWDEKNLERLKKLWDEGLPITKIGLELGVSRNSIAGKARSAKKKFTNFKIW